MAVIQHLALPVMMVVILCASIMLARVDAMSHASTSARRPTTTAAPSSELPIENYIARVVYWRLTGTYIGKDGNPDYFPAISAEQIQDKKEQKGDGYDFSNNEFLKALTGQRVTFAGLCEKIKKDGYSLMEAALRICIFANKWRKQELEMLLPDNRAAELAIQLNLKRPQDDVKTHNLAEVLKPHGSSSRHN